MKHLGAAIVGIVTLGALWVEKKKKAVAKTTATATALAVPEAPRPGEPFHNIPQTKPVTPRGPAVAPKPKPPKEPSELEALEAKIRQAELAELARKAELAEIEARLETKIQATTASKATKKPKSEEFFKGTLVRPSKTEKRAKLNLNDWVKILAQGDPPQFLSVRVYGFQETTPLRTYFGLIEGAVNQNLVGKKVVFTIDKVHSVTRA